MQYHPTVLAVRYSLIKRFSGPRDIWSAILPTFTRWTTLFSPVIPQSSVLSSTIHKDTDGSSILQSSNPPILNASRASPTVNSSVGSMWLDKLFWVDKGFGKKEPGALVGCG